MSEEDKSYDPSPKKLEDARKKGEVPRSQDLLTATSYFGFIAAALMFGAQSLSGIGSALQSFLSQPDRLAPLVFDGPLPSWSSLMIQELLSNISPWVALPALLAVVVSLATRSLIFAPSKLEPKLSKISPLSNAKNKFGRSGLFEFAKSFFKMVTYAIVLSVFLYAQRAEILGSITQEPQIILSLLTRLIVQFLSVVCVIALVIGGVDFLFQYSEHIRKNRMSHKEMMDETKEQEGDPHLKNTRKQRGQEIAMNQMLKDVGTADVVIVNPQHYAVALTWARDTGGAPICVAKGVDEIAAKIRELANEYAVPIHRDPPTARALYGVVDIGQEILPEHYKAVAAAIRFAETMRKKARHKVGGAS